VYVQMPDPRSYVEGRRPEHRHYAHILHAVLDPDDALVQQVGEWGIYDQFRWGFVFNGNVR